jgi:glycosyltransferase involved in cell wall biosynthesis
MNQARYLEDCLTSVSTQTYEPVEHVVMDGGSRDGSVSILERSASPQLRWHSEPDRGQAHALNKALAVARGSVIGWVNSDDAYADRRAVEWAVAAFDDPSVDVVFGHALLVNESNRVLHMMWSPPFSLRLFRRVNYVVQPTVFLRREALERERGFLDERYEYVFDRDLLLRLGRWAHFRHVGRTLAVDRHQRTRKVETTAYRDEAAVYDRGQGLGDGLGTRAIAKAVKVGLRVAGILPLVWLPSSIDAAFDLRFPSRRVLVTSQMLRPRSQLSFTEN